VVVVAAAYTEVAEVEMMDVVRVETEVVAVALVLHWFLPVVHVLREEMPTMGMLLLQFQQ
jgi:hypothetical protein